MALYDCDNLVSVDISASVTTIGEHNFIYCSNLKAIQVDEKNMNYCSINGDLYSKDKTVFIYYCKAKGESKFTIPNTVKVIEEEAFAYNWDIGEIVIPDSVTTIKERAFESNRAKMTLPTSLEYIGYCAFYGCYGLTSITISCDISKSAFSSCSYLRYVTILDGVTKIPDGAFNRCRYLKEITIPKSITYIGARIYQNGSDGIDLDKITFLGTKTEWDAIEKDPYWDVGCSNPVIVFMEEEST